MRLERSAVHDRGEGLEAKERREGSRLRGRRRRRRAREELVGPTMTIHGLSRSLSSR